MQALRQLLIQSKKNSPIDQEQDFENINRKIYVWHCDRLSQAIAQQAQRLARLKDTFRVALMPDAHVGPIVPNGCVLATQRLIYPDAIGRDIGCGVSAVRFDMQCDTIPQSSLISILNDLERLVPSLKQPRRWISNLLPQSCSADQLSHPKLSRQATRDGLLQLGTLGRGNHFIELGIDHAGSLWGLVHSGSRSMGQSITDWHLKNSLDAELNYLEFESDLGQAYYSDMLWAMRYASENRLVMLNRLADSLETHLKSTPIDSTYIDSPHNFARLENHLHEQLIVHRKSANSARLGELGIIPGSMAAGSRIVVGRGNCESLCSSSHGAGRIMSRSAAFEHLKVKHFKAIMGSIVFRKEHVARLLDESPAAYRSLAKVMQAQRELVATRDRIKTVLNFKSI